MIDIHAEDGRMRTSARGDGATILIETAIGASAVIKQMSKTSPLTLEELGLEFIRAFKLAIDEGFAPKEVEEDEQMDGRIRPLRQSRRGS